MKKMLLGLLLIPIIIGGISIVNANDTGCWSGLGTIPADTYATGIIYGCDGDVPVISIYSGRGVGITLKANNEGTGVVKIGSGKNIDAYGGLYQRGNSFSFPSVADNVTQIISGNTRVSTDGYGPQTISGFYYSEVWIKQMKRTSNDNRNTWGGGLDGDGNKWGYNILSTTVENRRGPCPTGYHIPSAGEWNMLLNIRGTNYKGSENITRNLDYTYLGYGTISYAGIGNKFSNDIMLPFIANREYNTSFKNGDFGFYWASSPSGSSNYARRVLIDENSIQANKYNLRGSGRGIRCFRDSYIKLPEIFNISLNNNGEHIWSGEIESGSKIPIDVISGYNLTGLTKEGYTFSGRAISGSDEVFDVENDVVTTGMTLNAVRDINQYTITFDTDGGSAIEPITADYGTGIIAPANPTKNGYKFVSWNKEIPTTMPAENLTIKAVWEKIGYSGGGGRISRTSSNSEKSTEGQAGNQQPLSPQQASDSSPNREQTVTPLIGGDGEARGGSTQNYTPEFISAYEFAHEKGITTMPTIQEAQMDGKLTRIAMAKMLSQYAMNVLGQKPANIVTPKFNDVTDKQNSDYDDGVSLAYQLGIMGQNMPNNKFRPNDEVTRAEFATALSRMLYHTSDGEYKSTDKYYTNHMKKLVQEKIITNDDAKMKELRGYVMIMLMRSTK